MKNKSFEQTVKQNLIASGVMFVIFAAVYVLAKVGILNDSLFLLWAFPVPSVALSHSSATKRFSTIKKNGQRLIF